ncbi:MAG: hypothetical protein QW751_02635 [Candidatus Aenigmatarchaeota archaeon]|nr:hypothetical protein [Candidatus Aenigmarchaeota archaeon]
MLGGIVAKIILGIVLVVVGLWLVLPASVCGLTGLLACKSMWTELWVVIQGIVPLAFIFVGLILIWIEAEELTMRKK